jgi:hypothetical protein
MILAPLPVCVLERRVERPALERNWSRHRHSTAVNQLERASTTTPDRLKLPSSQVTAVPRTTLGVKGSQVQILSSRRSDGRWLLVAAAAYSYVYLRKCRSRSILTGLPVDHE